MPHQVAWICSTAWAWLAIAGMTLAAAGAAEPAQVLPTVSADGTGVGAFPEASPPDVAPQAAFCQATMAEPDIGDLAAELERLRDQVGQLSELVESQRAPDRAIPTATATGQLQSDFMFFSQDAANRQAVGNIPDGAVFRRARFGFLGRYGAADYRVEMDFALSGRPSFLDVFAGLDVPEIGRLRVGHFFEPFSLERYTPNRFMTLLERSLFDQAFVPARNLGILLNHANDAETSTWAVGGFRTDSDNDGDSVGEDGGWALTARGTWLPWYDEACDGRSLLHVGGAYSYRDPLRSLAQFRTQPEARLGAATPNVPFFVDTGEIAADHWQLFGLETAWVAGPLSVQAEQVWMPPSASPAATARCGDGT